MKCVKIILSVCFGLIIYLLTSYTIYCHAGTSELIEEFDDELEDFSLEELMQVKVTSVSKKPEKLSETSAAVFVITQEDIQRSGATSIPEALRLAPGVQVQQIDITNWAVSIRGFNDKYCNKLLVLMDGRSVYTPIFSGVFWDIQDTMMEDIERIEVIRGPGSTLWGANAVNGIINIITKSAKETQGTLINSIGSKDYVSGNVRYGNKIGDSGHYRLYAMHSRRYESNDLDDWDYDKDFGAYSDNWRALRGGFRFDSQNMDNSFTVQSEIFSNQEDIQSSSILDDPQFSDDNSEDSKVYGGHILSRWNHVFSKTSDTSLQFYYSHEERDAFAAEYRIDILDFDFQHHLTKWKNHEITWGFGCRFILDRINELFTIHFDPESYDQHLFSVFIQDKVQLLPNLLSLTIGSKLEHNDFTGFEVQPGLCLLWTPQREHTVWAAVSRAVRSPSRVDRDAHVVERYNMESDDMNFDDKNVNAIIESQLGSKDFESEELIAYELGYRVQPDRNLLLDLTVFYNFYDKLATVEKGESFIDDSKRNDLIIPFYTDNNMKGETYGLELAVDWKAADWLRLRASYSYLKMNMTLCNDSTDTDSLQEAEGSGPKNQFSIRSSLDITKNILFDLWLHHLDKIPAQETDSYTNIDVRLAWKILKNFELSVVGKNLMDAEHTEFSELEVERSVYFKLSCGF
ncbi:iron complex outermembrane recepter protein [Candidatus Magnetomoraceae bacterium gMMP-15]